MHVVHASLISQVSVPSGAGVSLLPQGGREGVHFAHLVHRCAVVVVGDLEAHPDGLLQGLKKRDISYWMIQLTTSCTLHMFTSAAYDQSEI